MLISCEIGEEQSLYSQLKDIPEVKDCLITYGSYDIVAEFVTDTPSQMNEIIKSNYTSKVEGYDRLKTTVNKFNPNFVCKTCNISPEKYK